MAESKQAPVNHAATFAPVEGGRLVMICSDEENARPWVNLLRGAGLTLEYHGPGRYSFTFAELPEVNLATGDLLRVSICYPRNYASRSLTFCGV